MEEQNMDMQNDMNNMDMNMKQSSGQKESMGPAVGIIIIVIVLIIGGFYFFGSLSKTGTGDTQTDELQDVSASDDVDAIEQDLNNTNLEDIDQELDNIDTLLQDDQGAAATQ